MREKVNMEKTVNIFYQLNLLHEVAYIQVVDDN